ncbi:hypothetical protein VAA_02179 [Vibrio anguillarum 775]|nr:hypothetical protein VAA_02179 [Vibrio anguillarum 775]ARV25647.1 hypothetical protein A6A12_0958 [Vibrio anguillarum]
MNFIFKKHVDLLVNWLDSKKRSNNLERHAIYFRVMIKGI